MSGWCGGFLKLKIQPLTPGRQHLDHACGLACQAVLYIYLHTYLYMYIYRHMHSASHTYIRRHTRTFTHANTYIYIYICTCVSVCTIQTYRHTHTHIWHIFLHTYKGPKDQHQRWIVRGPTAPVLHWPSYGWEGRARREPNERAWRQGKDPASVWTDGSHDSFKQQPGNKANWPSERLEVRLRFRLLQA